ncbi:MAG: hemerythrin domain-containing protein [Candidatus Brocadiales bacterium]|nr:hemerythrin domain-containing protein [Candidatus Brocadiales bacterium]
MSELIEEFKKEHSVIMAILNEVKKLGIHSEEGRSKLISAKEHLLEHLHKENKQLYPVLKKEAEHNKRLQNELDIFTIDPDYLTRVAVEFFDDYSGGAIDKDFQINFESLYAALNARIRNEEEALYREYEKIKKK